MTRSAYFLALASLSLSVSACALFGNDEPMYTSGTIEENLATVTAKVTSVNQRTRMVSLETNDGRTITFEAGPEVKNLDRVDHGDLVRVSYYESVVYHLVKPGESAPGVRVAEEGLAAKPGEKPGTGVARMTTVTATVAAIDTKAPSVTFNLPSGERRTLPVRDANRLKGVHVGDLVEFTYTQALAIGVEELQD